MILSFSLKKYFISLDLVIEIIPVILVIGYYFMDMIF